MSLFTDPALLRAALVLAIAAGAGSLAGWVFGRVIREIAHRRYQRLLSPLYQSCHRPLTFVLLLDALYLSLPLTGLPDERLRGLRHGLMIAVVVAGAWLLVKLLYVVEDVLFRRLPGDPEDRRRVRRARTQLSVVRRLTAATVTLVAAAVILMTFGPLRNLGTSLLTSAGVVGVIIGLAARDTIGNAVAGLQLAFADTVHVDDVVVVEGEWGRIDEVKLTHVVVRLWDERRLILPTTFFTTKQFQNWTRNEARVVGDVTMHLDHTADVSALRSEARRIVEASPLWDRTEWVVQVIDLTATSMVVQVLASAADGPSAWNLRCELREKLIGFVRDQHPQWLPRTRAEVHP